MAGKENATGGQKKVQTKYDRKIQERKKLEEQKKRQAKLTKMITIGLGVVIIGAAAAFSAAKYMDKKDAETAPYVTVGNHTLTRLEYDYFYNSTVNNYLSAYSSFLPYMGLDITKDFKDQPYSETMSWKDMFDQTTVEQIKQIKAMTDDAAAKGFTYDVAADYTAMIDNIKTTAASASSSVNKYYKATYGSYATQSNTEAFVKQELLAAAYYKQLTEENKPASEEVATYYAENNQEYDKVDYNSFAFKAAVPETAETEGGTATAEAMEEARQKAEAMMKRREAGEGFRELSLENASEEDKSKYEDAAADGSLMEGQYQSAVPAAAAAWLYEDGRKDGDITVIEDSENGQYYVVEFKNRYYDIADDEKISSTIAGERVTAYINGLMENYSVTDNKGDLKYLTAETAAESLPESQSVGETASESQSVAETAGESQSTSAVN